MGEEKNINVRVRLIIINKAKVLMSYVKNKNFYFYIGGKVEYGETIEQACHREMEEECNASFKFKKILYVRDYLKPEISEHSVELYILGDIDKFEEVESLVDREFNGNHLQTWLKLVNLKSLDVRPMNLTNQLLSDYHNHFKGETLYLGKID